MDMPNSVTKFATARVRRFLLVTLLLAAISLLPACNLNHLGLSEVSGGAKGGFAKAYPNVSTVKWEKVHEGYEVEGEDGEVEYGAMYSGTGQLIEVEIGKRELEVIYSLSGERPSEKNADED